uniref:Transcription factor Dp-1 n=1 Tax=Steinernema glaseri TaxID=37863 RepID=A0A1I7ZJD5_9BILA
MEYDSYTSDVAPEYAGKRIIQLIVPNDEIAGTSLPPDPSPPRVLAVSRLTEVPPKIPAVKQEEEAYGSMKRALAVEYSVQNVGAEVRSKYTQKIKKKPMTLRHFATQVFEKVKEKGETTYNDLANELLKEHFDSIAYDPDLPAPTRTAVSGRSQ